MNDQPRWYIAISLRQFEARLEAELIDRGVECYLPRETLCGKRHGRVVESIKIRRPLMPGYVFVRLDGTAAAFQRVRDSFGFARFLQTQAAERPMWVAAEDVERVREAEGLGQFDRTPKPKKKGRKTDVRFEQGDLVRIADGGPFDRFEGPIAKATRGRPDATVEVMIFGRATPVIVDVLGLQLLTAAKAA